jgi:hypothetical protein
MHLPVEKHKIIVKNCQLKYEYQRCFKIDAMYLQPYKQNLLNFRHHFLFGVSSKISSFWHYFTDKALNILFKFVCRLRNVSKIKNFEFSHNLKRYIIYALVLSACYVAYKKTPLNLYRVWNVPTISKFNISKYLDVWCPKCFKKFLYMYVAI